jgi:hypothetical protein
VLSSRDVQDIAPGDPRGRSVPRHQAVPQGSNTHLLVGRQLGGRRRIRRAEHLGDALMADPEDQADVADGPTLVTQLLGHSADLHGGDVEELLREGTGDPKVVEMRLDLAGMLISTSKLSSGTSRISEMTSRIIGPA